jgi:hypothetical protein
VLVVVAGIGDACRDEWLLVVVVVGDTGLVLDEERRAEGDAWMVGMQSDLRCWQQMVDQRRRLLRLLYQT